MRILCALIGLFVLIASRPAVAGQRILTDNQLDAITAGNTEGSRPGGGAIGGNSSTATLSFKGTVHLEGNAQADARALNLVNSSESAIANGVNVWDGRVGNQTDFVDGLNGWDGGIGDGADFAKGASFKVEAVHQRVAGSAAGGQHSGIPAPRGKCS